MRLPSLLASTVVLGASFALLLPCGPIRAVAADGPEPPALTEARRRMVELEVAGAGIKDARVCQAMRDTPRHKFVSTDQRQLAYFDLALPIGCGQTISPPFIVAMMTQALDPQPHDRVLEIGTGSGYQAAVLSHLVADVYSIEIQAPLGRKAARVLEELEYDNVHTKIDDGYKGWAEHAPFNKIIVTCSPERIPKPLIEQLAEGGRIVIPLGDRYQQTLYRFRKVDGDLKTEVLESTFFVPMTGTAEEIRRDADDSGFPRLVNGDFEAPDEQGAPYGWYYVRQGKLVPDPSSRGGNHVLQFSNNTPGRGAQALQALGIDGRLVRKLDVSVRVRVNQVKADPTSKRQASVAISFFDEGRSPIRTEVLGPWSGTMDWIEHTQQIGISSRCRLAVVAVGMFGAVGQFSLDDLSIRAVDE